MIFDKYNLALVRNGELTYSSDRKGLRPIYDCFRENDGKDCILYDKVIGLAAAKIAKGAGVKRIVARVISRPALEFLDIDVKYEILVDNILNSERKGICPMEKRAIDMKDEDFFREVEKVFGKL